jgi:hypothetical protein
MMNIDDRILMEAIETRARHDLRERERSQYPDDYWDRDEQPQTVPLHPPTCRVKLQPDELALHENFWRSPGPIHPFPAIHSLVDPNFCPSRPSWPLKMVERIAKR